RRGVTLPPPLRRTQSPRATGCNVAGRSVGSSASPRHPERSEGPRAGGWAIAATPRPEVLRCARDDVEDDTIVVQAFQPARREFQTCSLESLHHKARPAGFSITF